ncbi:MAG: DUF1080 domain-containing protein [Gammaproteobacteria bacterium]|nr:DUF1080 domain-containing protein [Gammaproteobacteria bacterium]
MPSYRTLSSISIALLLSAGAAVAADNQKPTADFDGSKLAAWNVLGDANWQSSNDEIVANAGKGFLVTADTYRNFVLTVDYWADSDTNSGVFIRCQNPAEPVETSCYEINIYDKRPDQSGRTGAIPRHAPPVNVVDGENRWNTFEITADGSNITVKMNDVITAQVTDETYADGYVALQFGQGLIRFRNLQIKGL